MNEHARSNHANGAEPVAAADQGIRATDATPPAMPERLLRWLVPRLGPLPSSLAPGVIVGILAGVAAVAMEYRHETAEQLVLVGAWTFLAAGAAATALTLPAAHTIASLLRKERELGGLLVELDGAREEFKVNEQRFRNIAEAASDWFWEMGPDLRFTYFSERAEEVVGVPIDYHMGKTRVELAGEDVNTEKWQQHLKDMEDHKPFRDFRFIRKGHDGRLQYLSTSGKPLFAGDGEFLGYIGVGFDLTPQVEAQEQVRLANERLAVAINSMTEVFSLWGPDDRLIICNEQFRRMNASIIETTEPGTPFADHVAAALAAGLYPDAAGREEDWRAWRLARHADPEGPFEQPRQDGQWIYLHEQKLPDGSTMTVATDITEIKAHEAELARSEQRLADFADTAADWFWEQDENLRFTYVSATNLEITGLTADSHYGLTRRETKPLGVSEADMRAHEAVLEAREPFDDFRFFRVRSDGTRAYLSTSGKPLFDADGNFLGYRGVGRDVTFLVEAEQRVREERDRAEAANKAKSDFLAHMSHELRTPLNAILGFSQVIRDEILGPVGADHYREYAADIHRSGEHLLSLINDLLDLSKIEAGKLELEEEPLAIGQVIDDLRRLFAGTAEDAGVKVDVRVAPGLPHLLADYRALRQMITNLLSNAIKFTGAGGQVTLGAARDERGGLAVSISDTGSGFSRSDMELVLSPFGRVNQPMVRDVEGTGLGLPIVRNLIELHGGTIELASEAGRGTRATLTFPPARLVDAGGTVRAG